MISPRLFVHRHYDALKIVGIYVNVLLAGGLFLYAINLNVEGGKRTTEVTKQIVEANADEQEKQTKILQKQLDNQARQSRAQCVLLFELIGQTALKNIDPSVRRDCLNRVGEHEAQESTQPSRSDTSAVPRPQQPETQRSTEPTTSAPPDSQPTVVPPTPESPNLIQRIVDLPGQVLDGVRGLLP